MRAPLVGPPATAAAKRPVASPQTPAGKAAAATMSPRLADLDRKALSSKLVARTCLTPAATPPRKSQVPALAALVAAGRLVSGVEAVFVDPDTGISRSKAAA